MERLTSSQIAEFNNPLAFARPRSYRAGQVDLDAVRSAGPLRTGDMEESFRLVTGAATRLETLEGNLGTMLGLAQQGQRARGNTQKLEEVYGKLRSLSAGFDQVVDAVQFKGRTVFDGSMAMLSMGVGARPLQLDMANLKTYGEDSLGLSLSSASAKVSIGYRAEDRIVNASYDIIGLDISDSAYIAGSNAALELESGEYKVNIAYTGANSTVELRSRTGALIERQDSVDLSGSGRRWVDFDAGIRLEFELENFFSSFDKYDFEAQGPANLQATLNYERIETHELRTGDAPPPDAAKLLFDPVLSGGEGTLKVSNPEIRPVDVGKQQLATGGYTLNVQYFGERSIVTLHDSFGRLKGFDYGVDLSESGAHTIDFGIGLSVEVNTDNFSGNGATLSVPVSYTKAASPLDDFDFRQYAKDIEAAIGVVQEQIEIIANAQSDIEEMNRTRNLATTSGLNGLGAFMTTGALSLLTGGGESSMFKPMSSTARFNTLSTQLFSTTTALPTQANQRSEQLSSLQSSASAGGWLSTFA